jgi:hypothetical protein
MHIGQMGRAAADEAEAFFQGKQSGFADVHGNDDMHVLEKQRGPAEYIQMAVRDRIERARIDGFYQTGPSLGKYACSSLN